MRREHDFHARSGRFRFPHRHRHLRPPALVQDSRNASSPRLDLSGAEKRVRHLRIAGHGRMRLQEAFDGPSLREGSRIPEHHTVPIYPDLHRIIGGVVLVDDGVQHHFADRRRRYRPRLHPLDPAVRKHGLRVLREQQIYGAFRLEKQIAVDFVLEPQVGPPKVPDLDEGTRSESLRILVEQQQRRAFQVPTLRQAQLGDQVRHRLPVRILGQPLPPDGAPPEPVDRPRIQVLDADPGNRSTVPGATEFPEQETVEGRSPEDLLRAAAAIVILALVGDRRRVGLDGNAQGFLAVLFREVHLHDDAEEGAYLLRQVPQESGGILESDDLPPVVPPDLQDAPLRVGEPADPLQVLVPPRRLPPEMLGLPGPDRPPSRHLAECYPGIFPGPTRCPVDSRLSGRSTAVVRGSGGRRLPPPGLRGCGTGAAARPRPARSVAGPRRRSPELPLPLGEGAVVPAATRRRNPESSGSAHPVVSEVPRLREAPPPGRTGGASDRIRRVRNGFGCRSPVPAPSR